MRIAANVLLAPMDCLLGPLTNTHKAAPMNTNDNNEYRIGFSPNATSPTVNRSGHINQTNNIARYECECPIVYSHYAYTGYVTRSVGNKSLPVWVHMKPIATKLTLRLRLAVSHVLKRPGGLS